MNIIFLDFDGVLATDEYSEQLIKCGQRHRDWFGTKFNPQCVQLLSKIVNTTQAQIVITSDWRNYLNIWMLRMMWLFRRMPGHIIGCTSRKGIYRGCQIDAWLKKHREVNAYVILDSEFFHKKYLKLA